jgi:hypothetical protein
VGERAPRGPTTLGARTPLAGTTLVRYGRFPLAPLRARAAVDARAAVVELATIVAGAAVWQRFVADGILSGTALRGPNLLAPGLPG